MILSNKSYAFGLYCYPEVAPSSKVFQAIYDCFFELSEQLSSEFTYIGVEGKGFSDKFVEINSTNYLQKLKKSKFSNIEGFTLICNPSESDAPAYDHFLYLSSSYSDIEEELIICCVINQSLMSSVSVFEKTVFRLQQKVNFDYGLGFLSDVDKKPELHILGADNGFLNDKEKASLKRWYLSESDKKKCYVRNIYPFNIFNSFQLSQNVCDGTLLNYLKSYFSDNEFYELGNSGLFVCHVPEKNIKEIIDCVSPVLL